MVAAAAGGLHASLLPREQQQRGHHLSQQHDGCIWDRPSSQSSPCGLCLPSQTPAVGRMSFIDEGNSARFASRRHSALVQAGSKSCSKATILKRKPLSGHDCRQRIWVGGSRQKRLGFQVNSIYVDDDDDDGGSGLIDAPVSAGDGFSFVGGKYSDEVGAAQEWEARGQLIRVPIKEGSWKKAKDPVFGLPMGEGSQTEEGAIRWFVVDEGTSSPSSPPLLLLHGFPSQSYSYRTLLPSLSASNRCVAADWPGFGFSDKPVPGNGFDYSTADYFSALSGLVDALGLERVVVVVQGYLAPVAVQWALAHPSRVHRLILINPAILEQHARLPSALAAFSNFLLGEIFAQDPLRASDRLLTEASCYQIDETDLMVYRRPYLTSGSAGFAVTAIARALKKDLKDKLKFNQTGLASADWSVPTSIIWGKKDRWLEFKGVADFARKAKFSLVELDEVGHHAQEDYGEEVAKRIQTILKRQG